MVTKELYKKKIITVVILFVASVASCINTIYLQDVLLNHIGTLVIIGLLLLDVYYGFMTFSSFLCISIFCLFHILGARYLYSLVPYNHWSISMFGWDVQEYFHFSRNHYDRFVHFIFGILLFPFLMEWYSKRKNISYSNSILFSWMSIQTFSLIYELIEWIVAITLSEKSAENYNGQQGDMWDAHKDMALAMLGSTIMCLYYLYKRKRN